VWEEIGRAGFIRHPGHWVTWEDGQVFAKFGGTTDDPWLGMQAWRPTLDAILLQRAEAAGAEIWQPCRAISPIMEKERVAGIITDRGEIRADHVIGATGGGEWLTRKWKSSVARRSPLLIASYGYIETEQAAEWFLPRLQATAGGWMWTAQVLPGVVAWTQLSLDGAHSTPPPALARLANARPIPMGASTADVTWRFSEQAAGPGWFLVGDAALVLDPASSHGVLRALMSGIMAADLSTQVSRDGLAEEYAAAAYKRWICAWFEYDAKKLEARYRWLPSWLTTTPRLIVHLGEGRGEESIPS
jgi:flavin-dependent dehydrogenase